jgi:hypothetical protein
MAEAPTGKKPVYTPARVDEPAPGSMRAAREEAAMVGAAGTKPSLKGMHFTGEIPAPTRFMGPDLDDSPQAVAARMLGRPTAPESPLPTMREKAEEREDKSRYAEMRWDEAKPELDRLQAEIEAAGIDPAIFPSLKKGHIALRDPKLQATVDDYWDLWQRLQDISKDTELEAGERPRSSRDLAEAVRESQAKGKYGQRPTE